MLSWHWLLCMAEAVADMNQMQQYTLVPNQTTAGTSQAILLPRGQPVTVGRMQVDARDVRISRQHVTVQVDAAAGGGITLTAQKPAYFSVQGGVPLLLQPGQSEQV